MGGKMPSKSNVREKTAAEDLVSQEQLGVVAHYEQSVLDRIRDFNDPRQEWRRLLSEVFGTFFLVLVAAGGR
jgi:hypothetical protein